MRTLVIGLSLLAAYTAYFVMSMSFSAIETGKGRVRCESLITKLHEECDIEKVFAKYGANIMSISPSWGGKTCGIVIHLEEGSPIILPPEVDEYILKHPELGDGNRVTVTVCIGNYWDDVKSHKKRNYFWWRILY